MEEHVVLVDENNKVLGTAIKKEIHTDKTPLHRGFSLFLFNKEGKFLVQQRSHIKKTWPLMWSNSCCGHPRLDESNVDAVKRKLKFELGMTHEKIKEVSSYRYSFTKDGVKENEICPILIGTTDEEPIINKDEVENAEWVAWKAFLSDIKNNPEKYSPWCIEETEILLKTKEFNEFLNNSFL